MKWKGFFYGGNFDTVSWMENSDSQNIFKESLIDQFKLVKTLTNMSHVEEFGNLVKIDHT